MVEKLLKVQRLDLEMDAIRQSARIYPERLIQLRAREAEKRKALDSLKISVQAMEKERKEQEDTLTLEEERLKKSRARLNTIKTNFEFQAMMREVEATQRANKELEEKILKKEEEIEQLKKVLAQSQTEWSQCREELIQSETEASAKLGEVDGVLKLKVAEQEATEKEIDRSLLSKYKMIRSRKHTDALVSVIGYSCQGCHMNIPPQLMNEILRAKGIHSCPNCQRLIYVAPESAAS